MRVMSASLRRADFATGAGWRLGLPPGVYEARATLPAPRLVRLDTAAFIGLAQRGPLNTPVPVDSAAAFARTFGVPIPGMALPQAIAAFFAEGGRRAVVIRCMDHRNARTARFVLPGLSIAQAAPPRRAVRVAARNPGAWGNGLLLRLSAPRRAFPMVPELTRVPRPGGGTMLRRRYLVPTQRGFPGTTLRLPGRLLGEAAWHIARVTEVEPAGRGTVRLTLDPPPPSGFRRRVSAQAAEEILLRLDIALDGKVIERWDEAGLDWRHPRFLPRLLGRRAASEALLPAPIDGSDPETEAGSPDRIWGGVEDPTGSELLRPSALLRDAWLLPSHALLAAPEGLLLAGAELVPVRRGADAEATTRRDVFLRPTEIDPVHRAGDADHRFLLFADRPAALDALGAWDVKQPFSPAALVVLPDLLHPAAPRDLLPDPPAEPGTPCFGPCLPVPAPRLRRAQPYPWLGPNLADLRAAQQAVVEHCEADATRIALLDLPPLLTPGDITAWRRALASDRAALYAPWLIAADASDVQAAPLTVPPAAAAAGIVARVEAAAGPWSAPANQEIRSAFALADDPGLPDAGFLHEERVDMIRPTERGLMLLGSRSTSFDLEWTHISVRRLVDWLKAQLMHDLAFAPFEPNGPSLWDAMARIATRRVRAVFDAGALAGRSAAEAFFVRCDETTTPRSAQDAGQAIMLVGVAPAAPAEFIVFRLVRSGAGDSTLEAFGP